jgi:membrane protease YdiL (CAAX protease family)
VIALVLPIFLFIVFALASAKTINTKKTKECSAEGRNVDRVTRIIIKWYERKRSMSTLVTTAPLRATSLKGIISRRPLLAVFILTFAFTWIIITAQLAALYGLPSILVPSLVALLIGSYGFVWAALSVTGATGGLAGIGQLLGRYLRWRVGIHWYLIALFGPLAYMLGGLGLYRLFGGSIVSVPLFSAPPIRVLLAFLPGLALMALTNPEELVWRGVALPRLQARHSALTATLIVAAVEGLWHLPYFFVPGHFI